MGGVNPKGGLSHAPSIIALYCGVKPDFIRDSRYRPEVYKAPAVYVQADVFLCCPSGSQKPPPGFDWEVVETVGKRKIYSCPGADNAF